MYSAALFKQLTCALKTTTTKNRNIVRTFLSVNRRASRTAQKSDPTHILVLNLSLSFEDFPLLTLCGSDTNLPSVLPAAGLQNYNETKEIQADS